jgi:hypothetical protein
LATQLGVSWATQLVPTSPEGAGAPQATSVYRVVRPFEQWRSERPLRSFAAAGIVARDEARGT